MHITKGKKATWTGDILYDSNCMTCWKRQKTMETIKRPEIAKVLGGMERWTSEHRGFLISVWYYNGWSVSFICMSEPMEWAAQRMNPNINCGLWVRVVFQCRLIDCNKRTTGARDVGGGGGWRGGERHVETLYLLLGFAVNLKLLWKIHSLVEERRSKMIPRS